MIRQTGYLPFARLAASGFLAAALAGCTTFGGSEPGASPADGSGSFANIFKYGGTTVPASRTVEDEVDCPSVDVPPGASAIRNEAGGAVRSQISLGQTARECRSAGDQIAIKVGVEGLALLGPAGAPGTFNVPVRIVVKRGETVVATRLYRGSVTIPKNDTQASFIVIEENIMVPKADGELAIEAGFDTGGRAPPRRRPRG
jgi:hypothetical protein